MEKQTVALQEALLRRKELQEILDRIKPLQAGNLFVTRIKRIEPTENVSEVTAQVPRIKAEQVDAYHNWHARQLRLIDAVIQKANWGTEVEVPASTMTDFKEEPWPEDKHPDAVK